MVFTVSELNRHIKQSLEPLYTDIWVEGEISNLRLPASGHYYFTLKDEASQIRAVLFRAQSRQLRFSPEDGLKVLCHGSLGVYEPRGEYQIIVTSLEVYGLGALQLAFEQLKQRLAQEGLFDAARKKPLPFLPAKIAVISSPTGAVVHDIIRIVHRRLPSLEILIVPVRVQGDEAADEIVAAIQTVNLLRCADVIIIARGGGSLEDLQPFNTEKVARAVAASDIPIISAVGHETDITIIDFVADMRAPTPSAAAELVVREKRELVRTIGILRSRALNAIRQYIHRHREATVHQTNLIVRWPRRLADLLLRQDDLRERLIRILRHVLTHEATRLSSARRILLSLSPSISCKVGTTAVTHYLERLHRAMQSLVRSQSTRFSNAHARLNALNPSAVLERGFSITRLLPSMKIVRSADAVQPGDTVRVTLYQGGIDCLVKRVIK